MRRSASAAVLVLAYVAFVSLGLPDAVIGVAWPSIREEFTLAQALLGAPLAITAASYFVSGLLAGRLLERFGVGWLLAGSTALVAAGLIAFATAPAFAVILIAAPVIGFGSGAIDAALNTYGAQNFGPKHMSWLHAAYAAGATAGPAIMTVALGAGSWRAGYGTLAVLLSLLTITFTFTRRAWAGPKAHEVVIDAPGGIGPMESPRVSGWSALRNRRVLLQLGIFFCYTGLESATGQWSFTILSEGRGLGPIAAGTWVAIYWGGLLAGRIVLGPVAERIGAPRLLRLATIGVVVGSALFAIPGAGWGAVALPFLGFALASIFPGLMAETPRRVGSELTPHAIGFQVSAATLGVAAVPILSGLVGQHLGLAAIGPLLAGFAVVLLLLHERLVAIADRVTEDQSR